MNLDAKAGDLFVGEKSGEWVKVISNVAAGTGITVPINNTGSVDITNSSKLTLKGARGSDLNQGNLGDCYLLSSLSAVAESNIASIDGTQSSVYPGDMFVDNGDGTFGVRWYDNSGLERWVTVDRFVPGYRSKNSITSIRHPERVGRCWRKNMFNSMSQITRPGRDESLRHR